VYVGAEVCFDVGRYVRFRFDIGVCVIYHITGIEAVGLLVSVEGFDDGSEVSSEGFDGVGFFVGFVILLMTSLVGTLSRLMNLLAFHWFR
jgi:hypothetical protein